MVFYTDGSQGKIDGKTTNSAAICQVDRDFRIPVAKYWNLGPMVEVADTEITAITKALQMVLVLPQKPRNCYVFSDSQAAILKLNGHSQAAQRAKDYLIRLARYKTTIHIHWCPSHYGIQGNEIADVLAKNGLNASPDPTETFISTSYLRRVAKTEIIERWENDWYKEQEREEVGLKIRGLGKQYRALVQGNLSFSLKPKLPSLPRKHQSAYIQLKMGIGYLKPFQKVIGNSSDDRCRTCMKKEDTEHLVLHCTKYEKERKKMKKVLDNLPLTTQILFCTNKGKDALAEYLIGTKICTAEWLQE
jgi:ribonuclease HI